MSRMIPTHRMLICLQYWRGDRDQAMQLARLIADLQPGHSEEADFLFVGRFDCPHDQASIKYVSRRFNVFTHTTRGRATGWPLGCNDLFFGAMNYALGMMKTGRIPHYPLIFTCEADGVPLVQNWIARLKWAWVTASKARPICMAGHFIPDVHAPNGIGHINGNALVSGDLEFLEWLKKANETRKLKTGWDWILAEDFRLRGWADVKEIRSAWRRPALSEEEYAAAVDSGVAWFHGVKEDALLNMSRKKLLL